MITRISAKGFRSLRDVDVAVKPFQVLVGPNGSGKSSLLDVLGFLADVTTLGVPEAVSARGDSLRDLTWAHGADGFTLAVEAKVPGALQKAVTAEFDRIHYRMSLVENDHGAVVAREKMELLSTAPVPHPKILLERAGDGRDKVYWEHPRRGDIWGLDMKSNPQRSVLGNVPHDDERLPLTLWFHEQLTLGLRRVLLQESALRQPVNTSKGKAFSSDGSYLPAAVARLDASAEKKTRWIEHLQTALPDIEDVTVQARPEDRRTYLSVKYHAGVEVPSWAVSDGTLRLMALTVLAYDPESAGKFFLVEQPEDGIHPRALETAYQSLEGMYDAQVMLTTHSSLLLNIVELEDVLCFTRSDEEGTRVVPGAEHPALRDWQRDTNLGMLFAAGVLE